MTLRWRSPSPRRRKATPDSCAVTALFVEIEDSDPDRYVEVHLERLAQDLRALPEFRISAP